MSFLIDTTYRSNEVEIMDDFSIGGDLLRDTLDKIERINRWLGGNKVTVNGLKKLLKNHPKEKELTIIDLGCGHGDILREVAGFGRKEGYIMKLIGVDANPNAINYANELSQEYPEISFCLEDIFSEEFKNRTYDVALATLFAHHFKDDELIPLLKNTLKSAKKGIVVNDLHRHKLAYYLFRFLCLFIKNKMVITDGSISILRGFKKKELVTLSKAIQIQPKITWKWAFRFQWLIQK